MRNFLTKYKSAIILLVIILIGFWLYSMFFPQIKEVFNKKLEPVGEEVFATLQTIEILRLDDSIFTNKDYLKLQDMETPVNSQLSGRANPFSSTGRDVGGTLRKSLYEKTNLSNIEPFLEIGSTTEDTATKTQIDIIEGADIQ